MAVPLFMDTNMAAMTSRENTPFMPNITTNHAITYNYTTTREISAT